MISIIVPAFNADRFLEKCLNSILDQTFSEFEIILINDGSQDNTLIICEQFAKKDSRVVLINQDNQGISIARNTGILKAQYPYITFVDSDDWIEKTYLEVLFNCMTQYNADISICGHYIDHIDEKKNRRKKQCSKDKQIFEYSKNEALSLIFQDDHIQNYPWSKLYKKHLFDDIKYPENTYYEDVFTTYKIIDRADKIVKTNEKLLHYIKHESNITTTNSPKKITDCCNAFLSQLHFMKKNQSNLKNISKIQLVLAKQFCSLKKNIILNFGVNSPMFLENENIVNKAMIKAITPNSGFFMSPLFLFKYKLALNHPKIFLQYLNLTRSN